MAFLKPATARPVLACEITRDGIIAARASSKARKLEVFTVRRLQDGILTPGLNGANVQNAAALRNALSSALSSVAGKARDVMVIVPDPSVRVLLIDFEELPAKPQEADPVVRFRLKKSLPFEVEHAALSYDAKRSNGTVRVVAAVSPSSIIAEYESAFRDLGYAPGVVLPSSLASLGTIEGERPTLLLKVDPLSITIAAMEHQELRLIRSLDNPHGMSVPAHELAETVLPSIVFYEDTFAARIEQVFVSGLDSIDEIAPLLQQQSGAEIKELVPELSSEQNLSGEPIRPAMLAGITGALLG